MKNTQNIAKIDIKGFYDLCNRLKELEEENEQLKANNQIMADELTYFKELCADLENEVTRKEKMIKGLKINNSGLTLERNNLLSEISDIKRMSMWDFANKYCNDKELEDAGHAFARSLGVGVKMTPSDIAEEEFISAGEAEYERTWNLACDGDDY